MLGSARIEIHKDAIGRLLKSDEVLSALMPRGEAMAAAAGPGFIAKPFRGFDRVSVVVVPDTPQAVSAVYDDSTVLTRALGAARG